MITAFDGLIGYLKVGLNVLILEIQEWEDNMRLFWRDGKVLQSSSCSDYGFDIVFLEQFGISGCVEIAQEQFPHVVLWVSLQDDVVGLVALLGVIIMQHKEYNTSFLYHPQLILMPNIGVNHNRSLLIFLPYPLFAFLNWIQSPMQGMQKVNDDFYIDRSKQLGKGNYGVVFKGYHLSQNRIIAVKFMEKKMLDKIPQHEREIQVMAELAKINHPNIMGYYGYEKNQIGLFFFVEFCSGGSLKQLINKKMSELKVITLFKQLLDAMTYINKLKKLHRDLKPDNILLDQNEELKIADFGLARDVEIQMTKGACTPLYAAPQVLKLEQYDQKCDVWSAGLILYEMLVGKEMFAHVKTKAQLIQEIEKFKNPDKRIGYPKELHPAWEKITLSMLTFDKSTRPSFEKLSVDFEKQAHEIEKDLAAKYGYDSPDFDDGLKITKTLSPYQSRPNKDGKQDMSKKLKEERSFNSINDLRKFLTFFRMKNDMRTKLIRQFTANVYGSLKNVYKYLLMFLSTATYLAYLKENLRQIKEKRVKTPDGQISAANIEPLHEKEFNTLLADYGSKHENSLAKFKQVLDTQIIAKILGNYMGREEEKKIILECDNVLKLIQDAKNGKIESEGEYQKIYNKIMNKNEVYVKEAELEKWSEGDVKTYAQIRIIGNLDQVIVNTNYRNDDYLRMKKQEIENKGKADLVEFIRPFNSR